MMRKREDDALNARQQGTTEESAVAMLSLDAERAIYGHYRSFFHDAEGERHWNLWTDLPWDDSPVHAPAEGVVDRVLALYRDLLFLPDYASFGLARLRSSRGRAWFLTRWSYDEGKHLLTLTEWLVRRAGIPDSELKAMSDALLTEYRWTPESSDPEAMLVDALAWEISEIARIEALRDMALANGEAALAAGCARMLADDVAHHGFLTATLAVVAEERREDVAAAIERAESSAPETAPQLRQALQ